MACQNAQCVTTNQTLNNENNNLNNQINTLTKERNTLNEQITNLNAEQKRLNEQVTSLTKEKGDASVQLEAQKKENEVLKNKEAELSKKIQTLNDEKNSLEKNLTQAKIELDNMTKSLATEKGQLLKEKEEEIRKINESHAEEKKTILGEKETLQEKVASMDEDLKKSFEASQRDIEELNKEIESKVRENADLKAQIAELQLEGRFSQNQFKDKREKQSRKSHDCFIPNLPLRTFAANLHWPIDIEEKYLSELKKRMSTKTIKIIIWGSDEAEKETLMKKLSNSSYINHLDPSGISLFYPEEDQVPFTFINAPTSNIPIKVGELEKTLKSYFANKGLSSKEKFRILQDEKVLMDSLIEEFLFQQANVIIAIVDEINRDDQNFINRAKDLTEGKKVFVLYNLKTRSLQDLEKMILDTFDVTAKMMPFKEKIYIDNDSKDIKHAILTDPVIDHLRSIISDVQDTPEINLPESFAEFLSDQLIPRNETKRDTKKSEDSVQIKKSVIKKDSSFENFSSDVDYDAQSDSIILTKEDDKINGSDNKTDSPKIIHNPLIYLKEEQNKLFIKLNNDNNVIPRLEKRIQKPFTVKTNIEGCYLRLELEIAGECKDGDFRWTFIEDKDNNAILIISGVVTNNLQNNNQKEITHEDTRRFGEFEIVTKPIPLGNLKFYGFEDPEFMKDPPFGMKIMTFKLKRDKTDPSLTRR